MRNNNNNRSAGCSHRWQSLGQSGRNHRSSARSPVLPVMANTASPRSKTPLARRPAGALRADPAFHVSRKAAHLRADERDGEVVHRRRPSRSFPISSPSLPKPQPPADAGDPARMQRGPALAQAEPLQLLPQCRFLRQATTFRGLPISARTISPRRIGNTRTTAATATTAPWRSDAAGHARSRSPELAYYISHWIR